MFIHPDTFGSPEEYKMLPYLVAHLNDFRTKEKNYICSILSDANNLSKRIKTMDADVKFKNYMLRLTMKDFYEKADMLKDKCDPNIITHLKCYIHAKLKQIPNTK